MNLDYEVLGVGWKEPNGKPVPLLILYCGHDVEIARNVVEEALDERTIAYGRVYRGQGLAGQLMFASSPGRRPEEPGPLVPAGG